VHASDGRQIARKLAARSLLVQRGRLRPRTWHWRRNRRS